MAIIQVDLQNDGILANNIFFCIPISPEFVGSNLTKWHEVEEDIGVVAVGELQNSGFDGGVDWGQFFAVFCLKGRSFGCVEEFLSQAQHQ